MLKKYSAETAIIETTGRCNLSCVFCGSDCKNQLNPNELSIEEWCGVVDELIKLGTRKIVLSGGEPTLKAGVADLITHISSKGIEWGMVSNGLQLPSDFLKVVAKCKPYAIGLSIDGKEKTHNKLRGNPRSFQKIVEGIGKLKERKAPLRRL